MQFGKARAKQVSKDQPNVTFADVAGADEAVEELQEIKEFLEAPAKFQAMGAKIPKGVLLFGPPGTGKTLLARAVAGEAGTQDDAADLQRSEREPRAFVPHHTTLKSHEGPVVGHDPADPGRAAHFAGSLASIVRKAALERSIASRIAAEKPS